MVPLITCPLFQALRSMLHAWQATRLFQESQTTLAIRKINESFWRRFPVSGAIERCHSAAGSTVVRVHSVASDFSDAFVLAAVM